MSSDWIPGSSPRMTIKPVGIISDTSALSAHRVGEGLTPLDLSHHLAYGSRTKAVSEVNISKSIKFI